MSSEVTVVLADDHPTFRRGLRLVLEEAGLTVVGEAADGQEAVDRTLDLSPDVLVVDLGMPGLGGVEAIRQLSVAAPRVACLVLTMSDDDESLFAAVRAGARGYALKGADEDDLVRAVRGVARGEAVFGGAVAGRVLDFFAGRPVRRPEQLFPELTHREREVLTLVAAGAANPDIARRLFLSPKTVRNLVSNVFAKLQVADRAQAIVLARQAGLGTPAEEIQGHSPGR